MTNGAGLEGGLTALEIALGRPLGQDAVAPPLPVPPAGLGPVEALEQALRTCLLRAPCIVKFSGGRDSSVLLALTKRVADQYGLEPPIPVTHRFPRYPETDESGWQEHVIRHLGMREWERIDFDDEFDFVGPMASESLLRHGLLWPPNVHSHIPDLLAAQAGTVVTGVFGDEVFNQVPRMARLRGVIARRIRFGFRDSVRLVFFAAPLAVRRAVALRACSTLNRSPIG